MKQCKLCGSPLGKEPTTEELEKHWKKHHNWHWESNNKKTPEDALLKKQNDGLWLMKIFQHCAIQLLNLKRKNWRK